MIRGLLTVLKIVAIAALGLAFAAGGVLGAGLRSVATAFATGWKRDRETRLDRRTPTRRGIKLGIILTLVTLAVGGAVIGGLVFISGIVPIKASSRHWPITAWILNTGMARSVATHTIGIKAPPLDDPDLVLKGAGHYEIGCRPCHGSPGLLQPRIAHQMTPQPPHLSSAVGEWKDKELFYIVKHGVKFTGMPAWPALDRDDEIWAMVAFLRKLPELDENSYRRLAYGDPRPTAPMEAMEGAEQTPEAVMQTCARCHGHDGHGRGSDAFPRLAGQREEYLYNSLVAYTKGERHSGIMEPIATGLDDDVLRAVSDYYSRLPPAPPPAQPEDPEAIERGRAIAHYGIPGQRVPSCVDCHVAGGRRRKPEYPLLAGQPADYLVLQLDLLEKGHRGGTGYEHIMQMIAPRLKPEQRKDVARYFESLSLESGSPREP